MMKKDNNKQSNFPTLRFSEFSGEWEVKKLGEVADSLEYGMNASAKEFDGVNKYIRITDIDENSSKYSRKKIVSPFGQLNNNFLVRENDILLARTGASTGKSYIYDKKDGKLYFAGFLIRVKINQNFNSKFIFYNTKTEKYKNWVKIMSARSGQPGINSKEYSGFKFYTPKLKEQTKIADFLTKLDERISTQRETINKLEALITGYRQKLFSQELRFKDDNGEDFPDWEVKKLGEVVERITRKNKNLQTSLPLTISAQYGLVDQEVFFNKKIASVNLSNYYLLMKGEFAYNKSYSKGYPWGTIKRLDNYEKGALSTLYICFVPQKSISSDFLIQFFETTKWYKEMYKIAVEGARNHGLLNISVIDFFQSKYNFPVFSEQEKIANFLSKLDEKLTTEKKLLTTLEEQKKFFLQNMFV